MSVGIFVGISPLSSAVWQYKPIFVSFQLKGHIASWNIIFRYLINVIDDSSLVRLDYQPLFGKMSSHSSLLTSGLSSGRIKDRTLETAEIEPIVWFV